jgi:hypothetical protein
MVSVGFGIGIHRICTIQVEISWNRVYPNKFSDTVFYMDVFILSKNKNVYPNNTFRDKSK